MADARVRGERANELSGDLRHRGGACGGQGTSVGRTGLTALGFDDNASWYACSAALLVALTGLKSASSNGAMRAMAGRAGDAQLDFGLLMDSGYPLVSQAGCELHLTNKTGVPWRRMRASLRNVVAVARVCTCPPSPSLLRCLSVAPRRGAPPSRLPSRAPGGKPSSTDPGFSLDSLIGSSDEEPSSSPARRGAPHERQGAREAYGARSGSYPGSRTADSESSPASTSRSASDTADEATAESSPPARAPPPTFLGIVDKDGDVVALESEDERHLPFLAPGSSCYVCAVRMQGALYVAPR